MAGENLEAWNQDYVPNHRASYYNDHIQPQGDAELANRYRIDSHSGAVGGAHVSPINANFNDAVYLDEDNANSENGDVSPYKSPKRGIPFFNSRSLSVKDITSSRDIYASNPSAPAPRDGLCCLWIILTLLIITSVVTFICWEDFILGIYANLDVEGTYYYGIGWSGTKWVFLNDADSGTSIVDDWKASDFPLTNTAKMVTDVGRLLMVSSVTTIIFAIIMFYLLCSRYNHHHLLYIYCCCCKLPQRATLYWMMDIIKYFAWVLTFAYIILGIYGLLELNTSLVDNCNNGTCMSYIVPNFGYVCLIIVTFALSCFAFSKVKKLDIKLTEKSLAVYYPENMQFAESRNCTIDFGKLIQSINALKVATAMLFIILITFKNTGLVLVWIYNETKSDGTNAIILFNFFGFVNNGSGLDRISEADGFRQVAEYFYYYLWIMFIVNLCVFLPYFWRVIAKYKSIGCCKFTIVLVAFIEIVVFFIFVIMYYYEWYAYYSNYGQDWIRFTEKTKDGVNNASNDDYSIWWTPDYGGFLILIVFIFMIKFIYCAFKSQ